MTLNELNALIAQLQAGTGTASILTPAERAEMVTMYQGMRTTLVTMIKRKVIQEVL